MASIIKIKRSSSQSSVPGSLEVGEIAVNLFDRKLYVGNSTGVTAIGGEDFRLTTVSSAGAEGAFLKLIGDTVLSTNSIFLAAGEGIDIARAGNGSITFAGENASDSNKGIASFSDTNFTVSSGDVSLSTDISISGQLDVGENIVATGNTEVGGVLTVTGATVLNGGVSGDSSQWSIADTTGNITTGGTLNVTGLSSLDGGIDVNSAAFTVSAAGDVALDGQLNVGENVVVTGNTSIGGNLTVDGNLTVEGALTYLSTSTVYTDDGMMKLAANNAGDTIDTGIYAAVYHTGNTSYTYSGYFRDATDGVFKFYKLLDLEPTATVDVSDTGYELAQVDAVIDGGTY